MDWQTIATTFHYEVFSTTMMSAYIVIHPNFLEKHGVIGVFGNLWEGAEEVVRKQSLVQNTAESFVDPGIKLSKAFKLLTINFFALWGIALTAHLLLFRNKSLPCGCKLVSDRSCRFDKREQSEAAFIRTKGEAQDVQCTHRQIVFAFRRIYRSSRTGR